jgi:hypothetical protein
MRPGPRIMLAGIAALSIGFGLGLRAVPAGVSASETIQPKNSDPNSDPNSALWASPGSQIPNSGGWRVASLETAAVFGSATEDGDMQPGSAASSRGRGSSAEDLATDARAASFAQRFAGAVDWPGDSRATDRILLTAPDPGRHAAARRAVGQSARGVVLPTSPPASVAKKQLRIADASAPEASSLPPEADGHTAIYDIVAHRVYLPNGQRLEAHSGFGDYLDDPRYVGEKDRGPTPPNVYDLSLREEPFHGVRALRLTPVGGGNMFGRDGMLAHSYMLGPNGQSNGCVSFSDYPAFLNAVLSGDINRLVVVERLAGAPSPKTASGWLPDTIKALFGRS